MGSSFSDLDGKIVLYFSPRDLVFTLMLTGKLTLMIADASVTQSALEEALASRMQDGGTIGSRMSTTISNAFKSRYLPKTNRP